MSAGLRLVFAGTPAAAVPSLRALVDSPHEVLAVVTRPDAPKGRGRGLVRSAVGLTADELGLMPTFLTIGGDGASYDIGFGALSRILTSGTPLKVMVLNTGVYSNTGGQASTASYTGQDSDLSRAGAASQGKTESRKELGLIATLHPGVLVVQSATAYQAHFLRNAVEFLEYTDGPALLDVYTPCQSEQGIADDQSANRGRLAVRSRMSPLFVHDPRRGDTMAERLTLEEMLEEALGDVSRRDQVAQPGGGVRLPLVEQGAHRPVSSPAITSSAASSALAAAWTASSAPVSASRDRAPTLPVRSRCARA